MSEIRWDNFQADASAPPPNGPTYDEEGKLAGEGRLLVGVEESGKLMGEGGIAGVNTEPAILSAKGGLGGTDQHGAGGAGSRRQPVDSEVEWEDV